MLAMACFAVTYLLCQYRNLAVSYGSSGNSPRLFAGGCSRLISNGLDDASQQRHHLFFARNHVRQKHAALGLLGAEKP